MGCPYLLLPSDTTSSVALYQPFREFTNSVSRVTPLDGRVLLTLSPPSFSLRCYLSQYRGICTPSASQPLPLEQILRFFCSWCSMPVPEIFMSSQLYFSKKGLISISPFASQLSLPRCCGLFSRKKFLNVMFSSYPSLATLWGQAKTFGPQVSTSHIFLSCGKIKRKKGKKGNGLRKPRVRTSSNVNLTLTGYYFLMRLTLLEFVRDPAESRGSRLTLQ